jgi:hypothetical protein
MNAFIDRTIDGAWEVEAFWRYCGSEHQHAVRYYGATTKTEALRMFRQNMREKHPHAPRIVKVRSL